MRALETTVNGTCEETRDSLSAHLEGELRGFHRIRVLRHLARCERCRAVLDSLRRTVEQLRSLGRLDPSPGSVADVVVERVRHEPPG